MSVEAALRRHFIPVKEWAEANSLGINRVYGYLRREQDPLPHIIKGTERLIDDELAVEWIRRNFGVGVAS